jgi:hypothetical protein
LFARDARIGRYLYCGRCAAFRVNYLDADCTACRELPISVRLPIDLKTAEAKKRLGECRHRRGAPANGSQEKPSVGARVPQGDIQMPRCQHRLGDVRSRLQESLSSEYGIDCTLLR